MRKMRGSKNNLLPRIGYIKVHKMSDYGIEIRKPARKDFLQAEIYLLFPFVCQSRLELS